MTDAAADCLPILLGVTGKRRFDTDPARNAKLLGEFSNRFTALLDHLDHKLLPDTPKVLLCGGAAGVDLAAARVVLERPAWSVVIMLPFDRGLFEQDFREPPFDADLPYLRSLLDGHPRVIVKQMRPLHVACYDDSKLEPADAPRIPPDRLAADSAVRAQHFEQFGLWLARYATLLVAAAPVEAASDDKPLRVGGSARVVAYRRTATPDPAAEDVIRRSSELLGNSPFEEADGGHVLWIDPTQPTPAPNGGLPGVEVLLPIQRLVDLRRPDRRTSEVVGRIYAAPMHPHLEQTVLHGSRHRGVMAVAAAFQSFHRRRHGRHLPFRQRRDPPAAAFGDEHPAEFLAAVRGGALAGQQTGSAGWTRRAQRSSALVFFLALASYEIYTELAPGAWWLLLLYIALLLGIAGIAAVVSRGKVQLRAEDYRGLREMMRVQIAWWSAGIDRMVDRVHLRSIDTDLRLVREAAAAIAIWAVLRCTKLATCDGAALPRPGGAAHVEKWINEQAKYFAKNAGPQFGAKRLAETAFRLTFAAAIGALGALLLRDWLLPDRNGWLRAAGVPALAALPLIGAAWAAGALWLVTGGARGVGGWGVRTWAAWLAGGAGVAALLLEAEAARQAFGAGLALPEGITATLRWIGPGGLAPLLASLVVARIPGDLKAFAVRDLNWWQMGVAVPLLTATVLLVAAGLAPVIDPADLGQTAHDLVLVQAVLLLGGAGMVRWYTERRNHLAQASHYDDMLRAFRRAQDWLARCGGTLDREAREKLVELGELALDENEAWLKAHRDRPTEPIAGA